MPREGTTTVQVVNDGQWLDSLECVTRGSPDLVCALVDGVVAWSNPAWESQLGYSAGWLRDIPLWTLAVEDDASSLRVALDKVAPSRPMQGLCIRMWAESGEVRHIEWTVHVGPEGALICTGRDVTTRVAHVRQLEKERRLLDRAEGLARTGHWFVDYVDDCLHWSPEVFRIHGLPPDAPQPTLDDAVSAYHPEDRPVVLATIERAIAEQVPFEFELRLVRPSGEVRTVQSLGRPEVDPSTGQVIALLGVFRDVTDDARSKRLHDLELFSHVAAHDLRQPIRQISAAVRRLGGRLELTGEDEVMLDIAHRAASRMDDLVTELVSYVDSGRPSSFDTVDLDFVMHGLLADLQRDLEDVGGTVRVSPLPQVEGSAPTLRQIFLNLLLNSIRYRSPERPLVIDITVANRDSDTVVRVKDNGVGFPGELAESLFEPFRRHNPHDGGLGLGLSIVRRLARQLGGTVRGEGRPDGGATFEVVLRSVGSA